MPLSFAAVNKVKGREKPYKLADERGLYLLVSRQGGRYWRLNYRFDEKYRTIASRYFLTSVWPAPEHSARKRGGS